MTLRTKLAFALVAAVALAWLVAGCSKSSSTASAKEPAGGAKAQSATTAGAAKKPVVLVQAFYPLNSDHKYIADYVKTLPAKYPGKVKSEVYDMQTPEGRKMWSKTGLGCAGVFVNGRTRHTITRANGKKETVDFLKRMDSFWSKADFETVLKQELAHPSPLPPGGFSTGEEKKEGGKAAAEGGEAGKNSGKPAKANKPAKKGE